MNHFLLFKVDDKNFGLNLLNVERVVRSVEVTPLPSSQEYLLGLVDVQGSVIQALNTRRLLGAPERDIELSDQFIIAKTSGHSLILVVDSVFGVVEFPLKNVVAGKREAVGPGYVDSVTRFDDSLVLIIDLEKFVSLLEHTETLISEPGSKKIKYICD
ncbi:MAG: chemotaxis protein CheW [Deltaproteobacteria bacterium]|nr:chemotaxis protein CheW [Deltaproteobacteria bacterium]